MGIRVTIKGAATSKKVIVQEFGARNRQAYDIFARYSNIIMTYFVNVQTSKAKGDKGKTGAMFWGNRTHDAANAFQAKPWMFAGRRVGLTMFNTISYSPSLESKKEYRSLQPLTEEFEPQIRQELKNIYGDPS